MRKINRGRFKLQLILAVLANTLCRPATAQTLIDNQLIFPVGDYVFEATDSDTRLCGTSKCEDMVVVGKFRSGGTETSDINVFVATVDINGTPTVRKAWTHTSVEYSNTPMIYAGTSYWMVAVHDSTGTGKIYFTHGDTSTKSDIYQGTVKMPIEISGLASKSY